jgi:hypothetical protein
LGRGLIVHAGLLHEPALLARRGYDERTSSGPEAAPSPRRQQVRAEAAISDGQSANGRRRAARR